MKALVYHGPKKVSVDTTATQRGELVYEPFLGSGTTLPAAEVTELNQPTIESCTP